MDASWPLSQFANAPAEMTDIASSTSAGVFGMTRTTGTGAPGRSTPPWYETAIGFGSLRIANTQSALAGVARGLALGSYVRLGQGEEST